MTNSIQSVWIRNYSKESSLDKFSPHITIGIGEVESETRGLAYPIKFNTSKLALCHLGNYCTCRKVISLHDLKTNNISRIDMEYDRRIVRGK